MNTSYNGQICTPLYSSFLSISIVSSSYACPSSLDCVLSRKLCLGWFYMKKLINIKSNFWISDWKNSQYLEEGHRLHSPLQAATSYRQGVYRSVFPSYRGLSIQSLDRLWKSFGMIRQKISFNSFVSLLQAVFIFLFSGLYVNRQLLCKRSVQDNFVQDIFIT